MSGLALAGATAISTGIALPFIGKREPRYRILDKSRVRIGNETRVYVQTRIGGVWWTIHKASYLLVRDRRRGIENCQRWLREHLEGRGRPQGVVFDSKFDKFDSLEAL